MHHIQCCHTLRYPFKPLQWCKSNDFNNVQKIMWEFAQQKNSKIPHKYFCVATKRKCKFVCVGVKRVNKIMAHSSSFITVTLYANLCLVYAHFHTFHCETDQLEECVQFRMLWGFECWNVCWWVDFEFQLVKWISPIFSGWWWDQCKPIHSARKESVRSSGGIGGIVWMIGDLHEVVDEVVQRESRLVVMMKKKVKMLLEESACFWWSVRFCDMIWEWGLHVLWKFDHKLVKQSSITCGHFFGSAKNSLQRVHCGREECLELEIVNSGLCWLWMLFVFSNLTWVQQASPSNSCCYWWWQLNRWCLKLWWQ